MRRSDEHAISRLDARVLDRRFEALVFDWDGTAVPDRRADATRLRQLIESLCALGMHVAIVSGTHVGNVDGQLRARPAGPGTLLLALNRGSEVFVVDPRGPRLVYRRSATEAEERALDHAAIATVGRFAGFGLRARVVSQRLNRRKIDIIPEPEWREPPKARIDELLAAVTRRLQASGMRSLREAVTIARDEAVAAGLPHAKVTSDAKHIEIGLTDKADSASWLFDHLRRRGIGPGLVLIAGDEFGVLGETPGSDSLMLVPETSRAMAVSVGVEPTGVPARVLHLGGGPERFVSVLEDQLARRRRHEVPHVDEDPCWTLAFEGVDPQRERAVQALLTIADGCLGTRGSPFVPDSVATPLVLAAGLYDGSGPETSLLACPLWHRLAPVREATPSLRRVLDLRSGIMHEACRSDVGLWWRSARFSSPARPGAVAMRAECPTAVASEAIVLDVPPIPGETESGVVDGVTWMRTAGSHGGVAAAATQRSFTQRDGAEVVERVGAYVADHDSLPDATAALDHLAALDHAGFERLLDEHRAAWANRWQGAALTVVGDPELQLALRFGLFHLLASAGEHGEAAVGARGLTGTAYRGHVFWDADVFVLPVLVATHPAAARAMLEYRARRLEAARAAATAEGHAGARFPWESARSGRDVTPPYAYDRTGHVVPVRTGLLGLHITGCVAWATAHYLDWTGDTEFERGSGRALLVETARYWAARARFDSTGRAHLYGVIGPDEYHAPVDDNAFTNVLARWNLRRAAALDAPEVTDAEHSRWLHLADALVDGFDPVTDHYEQFAGFFDLEPLVIADVAPRRPIAADVLLGVERVGHTQVVKQADVLMMHHLLPTEVVDGSLAADLDYYEPRTAHGSSLSPGIHASLLARAGRLDDALAWLRCAARIDLDDVTATTAGGLHLAAMGSAWQAVVFGFLGVRASGDALELDPRVPTAWSRLEVTLSFRRARLTVQADARSVAVRSDVEVPIVVANNRRRVDARGVRFERRGGTWAPAARVTEKERLS